MTPREARLRETRAVPGSDLGFLLGLLDEARRYQVHLDNGGGHAYCGYPSAFLGGRHSTPCQGDVTCPACLMRLLGEARAEIAELRAVVAACQGGDGGR